MNYNYCNNSYLSNDCRTLRFTNWNEKKNENICRPINEIWIFLHLNKDPWYDAVVLARRSSILSERDFRLIAPHIAPLATPITSAEPFDMQLARALDASRELAERQAEEQARAEGFAELDDPAHPVPSALTSTSTGK